MMNTTPGVIVTNLVEKNTSSIRETVFAPVDLLGIMHGCKRISVSNMSQMVKGRI